MKTDYEILVEIREGKDNSKFELFNRYERLIYKVYNRSSRFFSVMGVEKEDFVQEAYLQFEKALVNFDFSKVTNKETFKFYSFYYFYLLKIKNYSQKEHNHYGVPVYTSDIFATSMDHKWEDQITTPMARKFNKATEEDFEEEIEKENSRLIVRDYLEKVSIEKRRILELFISNKKIVDIAKFLSKPYSEVYKCIQNSKKELATIYKYEAV